MRQSDEDHFAAFVAANSATLFRTAYLMTGDYQRAEDLLQTTLVRVYQRWTPGRGDGASRRLHPQGAGQPGHLVVAPPLLARAAGAPVATTVPGTVASTTSPSTSGSGRPC